MNRVFLSAFLFASAGLLRAAPVLTTQAEATDFRETGRYEEVERLCRAFAEAYPKSVKSINFGTTPEGRPMLALVVSKDGVLEPAAVKAKQRPVVLFQGGIHSGEIDGKDAGFSALRELLAAMPTSETLAQTTVVFVPVFNIDGHERFGPNQRPNQRGPAAMGWRTTGQNLNLNRDYTKADAPEMVAMLKLLLAWDPIVYMDLHVTDGAKFRHDIAVLVQPSRAGPEALRADARALSDGILSDLRDAGNLPLDFYPDFEVPDVPTSGFTVGISPPRFSDGYWGVRNRIGILVETHSWHTYKERVRSTQTTILSVIGRTGRSGAKWLQAAAAADTASADLAGKSVALGWKASRQERIIDFLGYAFHRTMSDISGKQWTSYDESKPEVWKVPLRDDLSPGPEATAPEAGYVVHAAHANWVAEKLALHGVKFDRLKSAWKLNEADLEVFRVASVKLAPQSFEGRTNATVKGAWQKEAREIPAGSLFVPIRQPEAVLAMHLFEPAGADSFLSWGFFNGVFEQKEYMEDYVAEDEARRMLAADPKLKAEFESRLGTDAAFASTPAQRLKFFLERHPSRDERLNLYPVFRTRIAPPKPS